MSNFIPSVDKTIDFEGDKVRVRLKPFTMQAFFRIMPEIQAYNEEIQRVSNGADVDENRLDPQIRAKMMTAAAEVLPDHIEYFGGLLDANGDAVEIDTMLNSMYFMPLVADLINELITISNLGRTPLETQDAAKNLKRQPRDNFTTSKAKAQA